MANTTTKRKKEQALFGKDERMVLDHLEFD